MRFFDCVDGKKDTLILLDIEEGKIIVEALTDLCKNNKRKVKAKKVLKEIDEKWCLY